MKKKKYNKDLDKIQKRLIGYLTRVSILLVFVAPLQNHDTANECVREQGYCFVK